MSFHVVRAPHINANDLKMVLVRWLVEPWAEVVEGQAVGELETTKATIEVEIAWGGFFHPAVTPGRTVKVGEPIGYVFSRNDPEQLRALEEAEAPLEPALISRKARELMERFGLSSADFPRHTLIGLETVVAKIRERSHEETAKMNGSGPRLPVPEFVPQALVIYGEINQATLAFDALTGGESGYRVSGFVDSEPSASGFFGYPVFAADQLEEMAAKGLRNIFLCGSGRAERERQAVAAVACGLRPVSVVHPSAHVSPLACLGTGVLVGAGVIVGPEVSIGDFTNLLAGATVAHHSRIGRHVAISDGAHLGGNVTVEDEVLIGIGVAVNKRIVIGAGATVVSGAVVTDNVPAGHVWRLDGRTMKPGGSPRHDPAQEA